MSYALLCKFKIECGNKHNGCSEVLLYESLQKTSRRTVPISDELSWFSEDYTLKKDLGEHDQRCGEIQITCLMQSCLQAEGKA